MITQEVFKLKQSHIPTQANLDRGTRGSLSGPTRDSLGPQATEAMEVEEEEQGGAMDIDEELKRLGH